MENFSFGNNKSLIHLDSDKILNSSQNENYNPNVKKDNKLPYYPNKRMRIRHQNTSDKFNIKVSRIFGANISNINQQIQNKNILNNNSNYITKENKSINSQEKEQDTPQFDKKNIQNLNILIKNLGKFQENDNLYLEPCEKNVINNPQYVVEYSNEIMDYLRNNQKINLPNYENNFLFNSGITERSRKILLDWLISVHFKFELLPNTLYMTINLIDRIIELNEIDIDNFQLLGVSAMLIGSKYEEIYAPEIKDFEIITGNSFTKDQIIKMENKILNLLKFDILVVSPYSFLDRFYFISECNNMEVYYLSVMFLELSFLDINLFKHPSSLIASSMLYMAMKIICKNTKENIWNYKMVLHSGHSESEVKICSKEFGEFYKTIITEKDKYNSIFVKYSNEKFLKVTKKLFEKSN